MQDTSHANDFSLMSEEELLRACQDGREGAFNQFIQRYQDQVFTYIRVVA